MFSHHGTPLTRIHTVAHAHANKLRGWVDSWGVTEDTRTHKHIWRNACGVVRWLAARKREGLMEKRDDTQMIYRRGEFMHTMIRNKWQR